MNIEPYRAEIEYKLKTTHEEDIFIFEQAEKKIKESLSSNDFVVARSTTLITLIIGLLVGLISFSVNRYITAEYKLDIFIKMSTIYSCYLFLVTIFLIRNIHGTAFPSIGAEPKTLFSKDIFNRAKDSNEQTKMFIWSEIENYQDGLNIIKPILKQKWYRFKITIWLLAITPIILLFSFYVVRNFWF